MKLSLKKVLIPGVAALALIGVGSIAFASRQTESAAQEAAVAPVAETVSVVVTEGVLVPVRNAELSFRAGGQVAELLASEGQQVAAGQTIIRLESAQQQAVIAQAEAGLARAQARLAELKAGPTADEVAAAESAVEAAQAQLDRVLQGAKSEDVAGAQAAVNAAAAELARIQEGASGNLLIAAQADVANADAAVRRAQAAYDRVKELADVGARPESQALEQATATYQAARARLTDLQKGASPAELDAARARVAQARAGVASLTAQARPADLAAAQAEVRRAQAQLSLVRNGARPEVIAAAEADVDAAKAAVDQAKAALADTELKASFAGTVAEIGVEVGEQVAPGAPVVQLADLSSWRVETTDLDETQAVGVAEGQPVVVSFDALPDLELAGQVTQIKPIGRDNRGDVTYTAIVRLAESDPRLRWNMTAAVDFDRP